MLIIVRLDLTEKGESNKSEVLESLNHDFVVKYLSSIHDDILTTEIVDVITED